MELTKTKSYEETDQFVKCSYCNKDIYIKKIELHQPRCKENLQKKGELKKKKSKEFQSVYINSKQYNSRPKASGNFYSNKKQSTTYIQPFSGKPSFLGQQAQKQLQQQIPCQYCGHPQPLYNLQAHEYQCQQSSKCKYCGQNFPPQFLLQHYQGCEHKVNYQNENNYQYNKQNENQWDWNTNNRNLSKDQKKMIQQLAQKSKHKKKGMSKIEINSMKPTLYRKQRFVNKTQQKVQKKQKDQTQQKQQENQSNLSDNQMCSICYLQFLQDDPILQLKCQHIFHSQCVKKWLQINSTCPNCKQQL